MEKSPSLTFQNVDETGSFRSCPSRLQNPRISICSMSPSPPPSVPASQTTQIQNFQYPGPRANRPSVVSSTLLTLHEETPSLSSFPVFTPTPSKSQSALYTIQNQPLSSGRSKKQNRKSDGSIGSISNFSSPLVSLLGEETLRRYSQFTLEAKKLTGMERCFYFLLFLVTFIYAIGIITAIILLFFHRWFFDN